MLDYEAMASGMADLREALDIMVVGLVTDGFTEEQARAITTMVVTGGGGCEDEDESG